MEKKKRSVCLCIVFAVLLLAARPVRAEASGGWEKENGAWYYRNAYGGRCNGWLYDNYTWYYLDGTNRARPGIMLSNCTARINGKTYFFAYSGRMLTGWVQRKEGWYYAGPDGAQRYGWIYSGGTWYYLDGTNRTYPGLMLAGTQKQINGKTYFFNGSGAMLTGWVRKKEGWYYADDSGAMRTGWVWSGGKWYYLDRNDSAYPGRMAANKELVIGGKTYAFTADGAMRTGWQLKGGNWYYYGSSGARVSGWQLINGEYYYFYPDTEIMAKSTTIDGTILTESGGAMSARYTLNHITDSGSIQLWNMHTSLSGSRMSALYSAIQSFNARGWTVGFVLVDIKTGRAVSYHAGVNLYSASAIKGPYVLSLLSAGYAPTGAMWNTISWSSNTDYSAIRSQYGAGVFQNWLTAAGVSPAQGSSWYTTTTPLDLAKMWLYGYSYLGGDYAYSGWARSVFPARSVRQYRISWAACIRRTARPDGLAREDTIMYLTVQAL